MKAYVITLMDLDESCEVAKRCMESAQFYAGLEVNVFPAFTAENGLDHMALLGRSVKGFEDNPFSRLGPCVATFCSHAGLWGKAAVQREPVLVLEHDAVFHGPLPDLSEVAHICNLGKPSFGVYRDPPAGLGPFVSKPGGYLGGAHAYYVTPEGADLMLEKAGNEACPTDIFINRERFPTLQEFFPWPVECSDTFSTIQKELGCRAKHNTVTPL